MRVKDRVPLILHVHFQIPPCGVYVCVCVCMHMCARAPTHVFQGLQQFLGKVLAVCQTSEVSFVFTTGTANELLFLNPEILTRASLECSRCFLGKVLKKI